MLHVKTAVGPPKVNTRRLKDFIACGVFRFTWNGYSNRDYFDAMVPPPMIPVNDTGDGIVVATELECIAACHVRALQVRTRRICVRSSVVKSKHLTECINW